MSWLSGVSFPPGRRTGWPGVRWTGGPVVMKLPRETDLGEPACSDYTSYASRLLVDSECRQGSAVMLAMLTQLLESTLKPETVMSGFSAALTGYFWLVKARREKPALTFVQLRNFRATLRRGEDGSAKKRLGLTQVEPCGTLVANNSTRQNAIIGFDCYLKYQGETIKGDWGYVNDDMPPWNIGPESAISLSLACFFDVPEDCEVPEDMNFRVEFKTASGRRFAHLFSLKAPQL